MSLIEVANVEAFASFWFVLSFFSNNNLIDAWAPLAKTIGMRAPVVERQKIEISIFLIG